MTKLALLPQKLLDVLKEAPNSGVGMALLLLQGGVVSPLDTVSSDGATLWDHLVERALTRPDKNSSVQWQPVKNRSPFALPLFAGLFAPETQARLASTTPGVFALPLKNRTWVGFEFIRFCHMHRGEAKKTTLDLEAMAARMLSYLPENAFAEEGARVALLHAYELGWSSCIDQLTQHIDPLNLTPEGRLMVLHSRRKGEWQTVLDKYGPEFPVALDPRQPAQPLWEVFFEACKQEGMSRGSVVDQFEDWFVETALNREQFHPYVQQLVSLRLKGVSRTPAPRWMNMLDLLPAEQLAEKFRGKELWRRVAVGLQGQVFLDMMQVRPTLAEKIGEGPLATLQMDLLLRDLQKTSGMERGAVLKKLTQLQPKNLPQGSPCYVKEALQLDMTKEENKFLGTHILKNAHAWWGSEKPQEAQERELMRGMSAFMSSQVHAQKFLALAVHPHPTAWLRVAHALASARAGGATALDALGRLERDDLAVVLADKESLNTLTRAASGIPTAHRKAYQAWLASAQLNAATEATVHVAARPRL